MCLIKTTEKVYNSLDYVFKLFKREKERLTSDNDVMSYQESNIIVQKNALKY